MWGPLVCFWFGPALHGSPAHDEWMWSVSWSSPVTLTGAFLAFLSSLEPPVRNDCFSLTHYSQLIKTLVSLSTRTPLIHTQAVIQTALCRTRLATSALRWCLPFSCINTSFSDISNSTSLFAFQTEKQEEYLQIWRYSDIQGCLSAGISEEKPLLSNVRRRKWGMFSVRVQTRSLPSQIYFGGYSHYVDL